MTNLIIGCSSCALSIIISCTLNPSAPVQYTRLHVISQLYAFQCSQLPLLGRLTSDVWVTNTGMYRLHMGTAEIHMAFSALLFNACSPLRPNQTQWRQPQEQQRWASRTDVMAGCESYNTCCCHLTSYYYKVEPLEEPHYGYWFPCLLHMWWWWRKSTEGEVVSWLPWCAIP